MAIWRSCIIDVARSLNSHDSLFKRKFENRAPASCRICHVLSRSTIIFELRAEIAEEINLEKCNFRQLSQFQKLRELDLGLGSGQGHISIHNTYCTTVVPNRVTMASDSTEIWPFEIRVISRFREVWTEGNLKVGLRNPAGQVPFYHSQPSVLSPTQNGGGDTPRKVQFSATFQSSEAPWPWHWPRIGPRLHRHAQYL